MLKKILKLVSISSIKNCPIYKGLFHRTMSEHFLEIVIKDLAGDNTPEEGQELKHIIREDAVSARQYDLFRMYWAQNNHDYIDNRRLFEGVQAKIRQLEGTSAMPEQTILRPVRGTGKIIRIASIAAAVALLISAGVYMYSNHQQQHHALVAKATVKGEKATFIMEDGTRVTLNADSKLEYAPGFPLLNREVYLKGEAFFDVHPNAKQPFIIHTDKMDIRVLGTAFNVKSYPDEPEAEATLIKGAIEVTVADNPGKKILLKPSQKIVVNSYDSVKQHTVSIRDVKPEVTTVTYTKQKDTVIMETSWLQNKLVFQNEDFETLAKRMERWYNVRIQFENKDIRTARFTGILERETVTEALGALNLTENFSYRIEDSLIVIY
jgi:transmembrane sensor